MFKQGLLYIEDMNFKIELGLEQEGTEVPTEIIPVDEKYLNRVLKLMPIAEIKSDTLVASPPKIAKERITKLLEKRNSN